MKWIKINKNELPENEVLAANFKEGTHGYKEKIIGYLYYENDVILCEKDSAILKNCTHFIDIDKYDI